MLAIWLTEENPQELWEELAFKLLASRLELISSMDSIQSNIPATNNTHTQVTERVIQVERQTHTTEMFIQALGS